ncbi:hypothetical protein M427DRAFT_52740 [Gonapodya prolifera JEL478]|uniref:Eukaryotic translation initiation factor 2D n=1 Tax=Gonapodya prolifera (strain JEL478) TaxID=1344416 RepID=A0A139AT81_GONPJ|nr:hypothetical protein M427DRAFT_52740 [Gonapodya prolifera JEL478]|eukprot:KXS19919.1 hypothetical protein M427DRAFT_52740 [Gonapodya prolifera JEL478]
MFKRPFQIKSQAPVRSSDRRKLRADILARFSPLLLEDDLNAAGWKTGDEVVHEKVETSNGNVVAIYRIHNQPWWFRAADERIYPSVYTLWLLPNSFVVLSTHAFVMGKLLGGADLMLPGVVIPKAGLPQLRPGDPVSVNVLDRKHPDGTPSLCVGQALVSTEDAKAEGMRGKGVYILHWTGDWLWKSGDKTKADVTEGTANEGVSDDDEGQEEVISDSAFDGDTVDVPVREEGFPSAEERIADVQDAEDTPNQDAIDEIASVATGPTYEDVDGLLQQALLQALKVKLLPVVESTREVLPMAGSTFFSAYIQTSVPGGGKVDVAKTSYKKLSKFLKAQDKRGLIKVKEMKGEVMITGINKLHPEIVSFQPFRQPKLSQGAASVPVASTAVPPEPAGSITVSNLYKPHGTGTKEVFAEAGKDVHVLYTASEVREVVQQYVKDKGLVHSEDPRKVKLDLYLVQLLGKEEQKQVDVIGRDELGKRFLEQCQSHYELVIPGEEPIVRKGAPPPILITIERRHGNKVVTKVSGLETYSIDPEKSAEDLRSRCGTGTTVQPQAGSNPTRPQYELIVQGSKAKEVCEYLDERWRVPFTGRGNAKSSSLIQVTDKVQNKRQ